MRLNFHYFTTKFIAIRAGYSEQEAQTIAATSQFINDNHQPAPLYLPKENVSEQLIKRKLCEYDAARGLYKVPLKLTAIEDENDFKALENVANQKEIFIPYYYFADTVQKDKENYSITAIETLQSSKLFERLFLQASEHNHSPLHDAGEELSPTKLQALRRLGVLLHIAADSFSFTPFNGYQSDGNEWNIVEVRDTRTFKNITDQYDPKKYEDYPEVGKYRTSTVSEDYNRQFILRLGFVGNSFTRINNDYYAKAAYAIYTFLNNFVGKEPSLQNWRDNILPVLLKCWNTDQNSYAELKKHWNSQTDLDFDYDPNVVRQAIVNYDRDLSPEQQSYFDFLLALQDVKDEVVGKDKGADNLLTVNESTEEITFNVSQPKFCGDSYELKISSVFPSKLAAIGMTITIFNVETQEQIHSESHRYKNTDTVDEKVDLSIPEQSQKLLAKVDYVWSDGNGSYSKSYKHKYEIIGNADLVKKLELIQPRSENERPAIQIVNGTESISADYSYPKNAQYTSQEGIEQIDLFVPIDYQIKLVDGYKLYSYEDLLITLTTPDGKTYKYCNNKKYISITKDKETGTLHIKAEDEWKNRLPVKSFAASSAKLKLAISIEIEVISDIEDGYRVFIVDTQADHSLVTAIEYLWNV